MTEWTRIEDKQAEWGDGPWVGEPDKVHWIDEATGLDCLANRNPFGAWCGYVGVPNGHECYGKDYDELSDLIVHGGLTYAASCSERDRDVSRGICHTPEKGRPADVWWLGFDCAHDSDIVPSGGLSSGYGAGFDALLNMADSMSAHDLPDGGQIYRTLEYVREQCRSLARQIAAVEA